jgi:hypothetical protein
LSYSFPRPPILNLKYMSIQHVPQVSMAVSKGEADASCSRESEICQSSLEVDAANERHVTELAKQKFCEAQALRHWSLHADRIQVKQADFRRERASRRCNVCV